MYLVFEWAGHGISLPVSFNLFLATTVDARDCRNPYLQMMNMRAREVK